MSSIIESEEIEISQTDEQVQIPDTLPVLPLRDIVIFPYMIVPLFVQRERSIRAIEQALAENRLIVLTAQRDLEKEERFPYAKILLKQPVKSICSVPLTTASSCFAVNGFTR